MRDEFGAELPCILDGGQSEVGIESTIVDLSRGGVALLRPGQITADQITAVLGVVPQEADSMAPRVSGALDSHYAPRTPVVLIDVEKLPSILQKLLTQGKHVALIQRASQAFEGTITQWVMPPDAHGYAHELYAALRAMDSARADIILIEMPPKNEDWQGINDRLRRAVHGSVNVLDQILVGNV